jgi:sugar phosphate isomerase/epimerase
MTTYVSTGGFKNQSCVSTAESFFASGIEAIELSGGVFDKFLRKRVDSLVSKGAKITLHNYVPLWPEPYVVNLASNDSAVFRQSVAHIKEMIRFSSDIGSEWYAFHGGYLLNPRPDDLGKPLNSAVISSYSDSMDRFKGAYKELLYYAELYGVNLLIENNVLSYENSVRFANNPLLLCEPSEIRSFFETFSDSNAGLLLDFAHFKVSGNSLKFDLLSGFRDIEPFIKGYHLSDNDGLEDSNQAFTNESWFTPLIGEKDYCVIEVYSDELNILSEQVRLIDK